MDHLLILVLVIGGFGLAQGIISGRAMIKKFPRKSTKYVSILISLLFFVYILLNVYKFENNTVESIRTTIPISFDQVLTTITGVLKLNTTFGWISLLVPVIVWILGRIGDLEGNAKHFVNITSAVSFGFVLITQLTHYIPDSTLVTIYSAYQIGLFFGVFFGTGASKHV